MGSDIEENRSVGEREEKHFRQFDELLGEIGKDETWEWKYNKDVWHTIDDTMAVIDLMGWWNS